METKNILKEQVKENDGECQSLLLADFMNAVIEQLRCDQKFAAVRTYGSTYRSIIRFLQEEEDEKKKMEGQYDADTQETTVQPTVHDAFQAGVLKRYQEWLRRREAEWGTVSTYMRTLRATYNRLVRQILVVYNPLLFNDVYTKVESRAKRALTQEQMHTLATADIDLLPKKTQPALSYFLLSFFLRGMPFIDLAYLQKGDLKGDTLTYCRHKTRQQITVRVPREAQQLLEAFRNKNPESIYLFPILDVEKQRDQAAGRPSNDEQLYMCYVRALHRFNSELTQLAALLLPDVKLSSYTPRHTWATLAFYKGWHIGAISKALGHSSIKVTEFYLKPFENEKIDSANDELISTIIERRKIEGMPL